jgi:hypothetical protein
MAHVGGDIGDAGPNGPCVPEVWVTGTIVADDRGSARIKSDDGVLRWITWGFHNPAVVDWGRRYTIGGRWFNSPDTLWACGGADSVIPQ